MKTKIIIALIALTISGAVIHDSSQDIQRAFRARARSARTRKDSRSPKLFIDD